MTKSQQDHVGEVGGGEPDVDYEYAEADGQDAGTSNDKNLRLAGGVAAESAATRSLDNIADDGDGTTKYVQYTAHVGASTLVQLEYPQVTISSNPLILTYGGSGTYGGFDRFGRIVDQKWQIKTAGTVKDQFKYAYDRTSNRISRETAPDGGNPSGFDEHYLYDNLDRLMKVNRGNLSGGSIADANAGSSQAWAEWDTDHWESRLEALGNWRQFKQDDNGGGASDGGWELNQSRLHNKVNEIDTNDIHSDGPGASITASTGTNWVDPTYDAAGNMKLTPRTGDEGDANDALVCVYDAWNRLVEVWDDSDGDGVLDDPGDTLIVTHSYDGRHRRIRKVVEGSPDVTYDYYYDTGWRILEVRKDSDTDPYEQYVWGIRYMHSPVCRFEDHDTDAQNVETLYYTNDANFNVTALIETDGDVAERYVYDPYGKVTIYNSDWSSTVTWANSKKNVVLYTGHKYDWETGLYYCCRRYLHPTLGRWTTRDPIGYADGMNLYEYVGSCPVGRTDREGLREMGPEDQDAAISIREQQGTNAMRSFLRALRAAGGSERICYEGSETSTRYYPCSRGPGFIDRSLDVRNRMYDKPWNYWTANECDPAAAGDCKQEREMCMTALTGKATKCLFGAGLVAAVHATPCAVGCLRWRASPAAYATCMAACLGAGTVITYANWSYCNRMVRFARNGCRVKYIKCIEQVINGTRRSR